MTMSLRLLRRRPAPAGRHSRAVPGPLVPGAAATLVAAADPWDLPAYADLAPADDAEAPTAAGTEPVATTPDGTVPDDTMPAAVVAAPPVLLAPPVAASGPILLAAEPAPPGPAPAPPTAGAVPAVSLGFADGALVDLPADDPRVRTFAAAAAAMLEPHRG